MHFRENLWQIVSGITGFLFALISNCTDLFEGSSEIAGIIQLAVNSFVFITWTKKFRQKQGFGKFVAFFGVISPPIMAGITLWRVLIPFIF